ncbi:MAG: aspartate carbamoyltransferase catalytic subunit [Deltaproteobacteria bacterium]|nr:aspartate carbamoyltransferase catalytic subunit [Deltaproteobacteria bacterium]
MKEKPFTIKHVLDIAGLSPDQITYILDTAESFKEISTRSIKKVPTLRGKTVINLFFEPSTRTRVSFEIAAKRLSADTLSISASTSSVVKGETLIDTARNLEAMQPDVIVLRHSLSGAPHLLSRHVRASVINAGDGAHEHPTQALLDLLTVREKKGEIKGLKLAIIGDIAHSRVAHSNILGFTKMGANVVVSGPATMIPPYIEKLGAKVTLSIKEAVQGADAIMVLRIQLERQNKLSFPSIREYATYFGLNTQHLALAAPDVIVMHPGPINRGVEISPEVADGPHSVILDQVTNGVAVRMALLYLLLGSESQ